jgi:isopentenyldiphosphate isomerase
MQDEWFDLINLDGRVIGKALRGVCHQHPGLIHQVVHVIVTNERGELYLQKRSPAKDIQPGKWDTSVGGHLQPGEAPEPGARRELAEELGVTADELTPAYSYLWESSRETERISAFLIRQEGPFTLDPHEISEGRFWTIADIEQNLSPEIFTEQFVSEFQRMKKVLAP